MAKNLVSQCNLFSSLVLILNLMMRTDAACLSPCIQAVRKKRFFSPPITESNIMRREKKFLSSLP